ncbi:hypothetical protein D3C87_2035380 [compost metagenome]
MLLHKHLFDLGGLCRNGRPFLCHELSDGQQHITALAVGHPVRIAGRASGIIFGQPDMVEMIG